ncbi:MAG: DMT family transporter [Dehalococcoidia bacterium]
MTSRQFITLSVLVLIWGCSFLFIRVLLDADMEPLGVSGARLAMGAAVLAPLAWAGRAQLPRDVRTWTLLAALGVFNFALPWTLFPISQQHIPSGVASIANACTPLWAAVIAAVLIPGEHFTLRRAAGLGMGFVGIVTLMAGDVGGVDGNWAWGILGVVVATLLYGLSAVFIRLRMREVAPVALATGQIAVAALAIMPLALATGAYNDAEMGAAEWGSLVALGGIGSGVGPVVYMALIQDVGPVRASVVTYLMPPIGVFLGWSLLDEVIGWNLVIASALIVSGVALVQNVPLRRLPRAAHRRFVRAASTPLEP